MAAWAAAVLFPLSAQAGSQLQGMLKFNHPVLGDKPVRSTAVAIQQQYAPGPVCPPCLWTPFTCVPVPCSATPPQGLWVPLPNTTTSSTDANGYFSIHVDYPNFAVRYRIMVAAQTDSAIVYTQVPAPPPTGVPLANVYNEGGSTSGRVESSTEHTFSMDYTFGATGSRYFAITYDIQLAKDFGLSCYSCGPENVS